MKLDFIGNTASAKYTDISVQRTVNWIPIPNLDAKSSRQGLTPQPQAAVALYPTPGQSVFVTIPGRYSRGGIVAKAPGINGPQITRAFCVIDTTLYEILANQSYYSWGNLAGFAYGSSKCQFQSNGNGEVFIGQGNTGYVFNMNTNVLTLIVDLNFPGAIYNSANLLSSTYCDGYLFLVYDNGYIYFSNANSFLNWTGSQVFATTFRSAGDIGVGVLRDKIYCFTSESVEPYYEDGSIDIWTRYPSAIFNTGALSPNLISPYDDGIIFVGSSQNGQAHVYMLSNFALQLQPITENFPNIQWALNSSPNILNDAFSYVQKTREGQLLYRLTVPQLKTTFCYNLNTQVWYEQRSTRPSLDCDGLYNQDVFRGKHYLNFAGYNLFMDMYSGTIFKEDYTNQTENGTLIKRVRRTQTFFEDYKNISATNFELDATKGVGTTSGQGLNPVIMFSTSNNGGHTFSSPRNLLLNNNGDYIYRTRITKLGTSRMWNFELVLTDPLDLMIQGAYANGEVGIY